MISGSGGFRRVCFLYKLLRHFPEHLISFEYNFKDSVAPISMKKYFICEFSMKNNYKVVFGEYIFSTFFSDIFLIFYPFQINFEEGSGPHFSENTYN